MRQKKAKRATHGLQFNVAQLLKSATGATRIYDIDNQAATELGDEIEIVSPITGTIKLMRTGPNVLVIGELNTTIQKACGRCLTEFTVPVSIEVEEEFYPTIDIVTGAVLPLDPEADEANRIDDHHILDLWEVVRQEFFLASDDTLYCRPDCKGFCPHCGRDRNVDPCSCEDAVVDPRWADLLALQQSDDD